MSASTAGSGGSSGAATTPSTVSAAAAASASAVPPSSGAFDFFSPAFDAAAVLAAPAGSVRAPLPNSKPRDTLHRCRPLLPDEHPDFLPERPTVATGAAAAAGGGAAPVPALSKTARELAARRALRAEEKAALSNQIDRFANEFVVPKSAKSIQLTAATEPVADGPMAVLRTLFARRSRVRVTIRGAGGVRGSVTGFLRAFDKHWNLIVLDAEECYARMEWRYVRTPQQLKHFTPRRERERERDSERDRQRKRSRSPERSSSDSRRRRRRSRSRSRSPSPPPASSSASSAVTAASGAAADGGADSDINYCDWLSGGNGDRARERVRIERKRHIRQLFIRGDQVVTIAEHEPNAFTTAPAPAAAATSSAAAAAGGSK